MAWPVSRKSSTRRASRTSGAPYVPFLPWPVKPYCLFPLPNLISHALSLLQDSEDNTLTPFSLATWAPDPAVGAVVCGLDVAVNYTKLSKAFNYLTQNEGCRFLVTNEDSTYPTADGLLPGAGSVSAPLRYALGRDPTAIGKPNRTMLDCIRAK